MPEAGEGIIMHGNLKLRQRQQLEDDVWMEKYAQPGENSIHDTFARVARGVYRDDPEHESGALLAMQAGQLLPAGRILAGAGTDKRVTLVNCYVSPVIQDSLDSEFGGVGIMDSLKVAALTQQMGGGIGMDFSTIRPRGAVVRRTQSVAQGVLSFMDMYHAMCNTVMSSGSRRGAMMGTLGCWHPDILDFITAKQERGRLSNFNVSVLVTDAFMVAVENNEYWQLTFPVPPAGGGVIETYPSSGSYVYQTLPARELWDAIIRSTYVHAEPGIIFIDRINQDNNLAYCEQIQCTNPCGEQPLPPNGGCNLGHINLAELVLDPFTSYTRFDYDRLAEVTGILTRFLDNVLQVSQYPTEAQRVEAMDKRRLGIGFTGLATALQKLGVRYGSAEAIVMTANITCTMRDAAYRASAMLARERGPFPMWDADKFMESGFVQSVEDPQLVELIRGGMRNGLLMSVAPTGTTSIVAGNVSSGIEPVFDYSYRRNKLHHSGRSFASYMVYDCGYLEYCRMAELDPDSRPKLPDQFVIAHELTVDEHLSMQAAAQAYVDASISKTINCPTSMGFEEFRNVYTTAYQLKLKGCTTYRPDPASGRGAVLISESEICPQCQEPAVVRKEGCRSCSSCGASYCG